MASTVSDEGIDKYLLGDIDDEMLDEGGERAAPPVIVPPAPAPQAAPVADAPPSAPQPFAVQPEPTPVASAPA
ncbi:MAG: hypothetical protein K0B85_07580, partial [Coriobacteriia bacterium]|nr:hypothetical protein [Coriobacteriia bacterium]